jgi:deoxyribodipyrimidine photo-lyase
MKQACDQRRVATLRAAEVGAGPVFYWMSRDQRVADNWALQYAQDTAIDRRRPLAVVFALASRFLEATFRQYDFLLAGLQEVAGTLARKRIPFFLVTGDPASSLPAFFRQHGAGLIVTDFSPLNIHRRWHDTVADRLAVPVYQVDAHNLVPCRVVSGKQEYAARTLRPKLLRLLPEFLTEYPRLRIHPYPWAGAVPAVGWAGVRRTLRVDRTISPVSTAAPGERAAHHRLKAFLQTGLPIYADGRNDPNRHAQSGLSPYLHFGQISAQRVAWEVQRHVGISIAAEAFLEELIVRRELADNFCLYNQQYDSMEAFPAWARQALDLHRADPRPYLYSRDRLEAAETHDPLWNAAQKEMTVTGKMHGYLRMYWAKKILEWSPSPEEALARAIYLNDRYELDGRDPNGYAGIAWSIGGLHDRPWGRREIFGPIRYMSAAGCARKFDVGGYIAAVAALETGAVRGPENGKDSL